MSFSNFEELRNLNDEAIMKEILDTKKYLFELRLKKATRQSFKSHLFKHYRHKIAQLLTAESQKKQVIK
nr:ribosomal protein L29 [Cryptomonas tetrapyrenoidosa]